MLQKLWVVGVALTGFLGFEAGDDHDAILLFGAVDMVAEPLVIRQACV